MEQHCSSCYKMGFTLWAIAFVTCICVVYASISNYGKFHDHAGNWFVAMYLAKLAKNIILASVLEWFFCVEQTNEENQFYDRFFINRINLTFKVEKIPPVLWVTTKKNVATGWVHCFYHK